MPVRSLSVVVPVYNEGEGLHEFHRRLQAVLESIPQTPYDVVFVDDGSTDDSWRIIQEFHPRNKSVKGIRLSRNFGHQYALIAGLEHARGDMIVTLDADLQDPPELIPEMIKKHNEGYDIVFGVRSAREADTVFKRVTAGAFYRLMKMMGVRLIPDHADYRLITSQVREAFMQYGEVNCFLRGIFVDLGFKSCSVKYERPGRHAGVTKYPLRKMVNFAIQGATSFSLVPLRLAFGCGLCIFAVSIALAAWALVTRLLGQAVPGWASVALPLYALGGMQLLFIGIIGEYVGKTYMEAKRRPRYIVRDRKDVG